MAKKTWVNIGGTFKEVKNVWQNVGGIWKQKVIPKGNIAGGWKEFIQYQKSLISPERLMVIPDSIGGMEGDRSGQIIIADDYIHFYKPSYSSGSIWRGVITDAKIDVTSYSLLTLEYEHTNTYGAGDLRVGATSVDKTNNNLPSVGNYVAYSDYTVPFKNTTDVYTGTITVDLSAVTGVFNIGVTYDNTGSSNNFNIKINKLILE